MIQIRVKEAAVMVKLLEKNKTVDITHVDSPRRSKPLHNTAPSAWSASSTTYLKISLQILLLSWFNLQL